jgi:hypothetical protein
MTNWKKYTPEVRQSAGEILVFKALDIEKRFDEKLPEPGSKNYWKMIKARNALVNPLYEKALKIWQTK